MKVGDYVRAKDDLGIQLICKINKIFSDDFISTDKGHWDIEDIIKSSPNIIDLIEVGDYVNGAEVVNIEEDKYLCFAYGVSYVDVGISTYIDGHIDGIETIVTKEQFEAMKYEVK